MPAYAGALNWTACRVGCNTSLPCRCSLMQVYSECPSYDELIPALLAHPLEELPQRVHFKPGVPIKPMLAKPTTGELTCRFLL